MLRKAGIATALLLALPAFANAWTLTAKIGSGQGSITAAKGGTTVAFGTYSGGTTYDLTKTAAPVVAYFKSGVETQTVNVAPGANNQISAVYVDGAKVTVPATGGPIDVNGTKAGASKASNHSMIVYYSSVAAGSLTITSPAGGSVAVQHLTGDPAAGGKPTGAYNRTGFDAVKVGSWVRVYALPNSDYRVAAANGFTAGDAGEVKYKDIQIVAGANNVTASFGLVADISPRLMISRLAATIGETVTLDASTTTANGAISYLFESTPAATITQNGSATATVSFPAAGAYTVKMTATSGGVSKYVETQVNAVSAKDAANGVCVSCHTTRNAATITAYNSNTHGKVDNASNYSCATCHAQPHNPTVAAAYEQGQSTPGVATRAGYVGATACRSCHSEQYAGWSKTSHNKPLKTIAALGEGIFVNDTNNNGNNDFQDNLNFATAGATLTNKLGQSYANPWAAKGANAPRLSYENGKYYIAIGAVKYQIFRTQGGNGKWKQRYHTKIGNAYYVLPVQYNEINGQYEDYNGGNWYNGANAWITAGTGNADAATIAQVSSLLLAGNINGGVTGSAAKGPSTASWDNRCAACHQTGVAIEYKSVDGSSPLEVVASSVDLNIGCESCHGPGQSHVTSPTALNIQQPGKWTSTSLAANNYYRANEVCGQCHSRTEGFGHFSTAAGKLYAGIEAPSPEVADQGAGKVAAGSYDVGLKLLDFIEQIIPATFKKDTGASGNNGPLAYDGTTRMLDFGAPDKHHQQWHDMELGKHGAIQQMGSDRKLTCFSCHDAHNPNSGNIKSSINGIATSAEDNSLCLACHAGIAAVGTKDAAYATLAKADINNAANSNEEDAVYAHLVAAAGYPDDAVKKASWKAKYMTSVQANGNSATFGRAVYKVGQCISCHMPFTSKSGIRVSTNANGRAQGDIRSHSMKPLWPGLTGLTAAKGLTSTTVVTSCSACHPTGL